MRLSHIFPLVFLFLLSVTPIPSLMAQKVLKGVVVDSVSLNNLAGVTVAIKNKNQGTVTDSRGIFVLIVNSQDTLTLSHLGYKPMSTVVDFDNEIMFIRLQENTTVLEEIVVTDRYVRKEVFSPTLTTVKPIKAAKGVTIGNHRLDLPEDRMAIAGQAVNFSYFSKGEKEKRKLIKNLAEAKRIRVYEDVIRNPDFKNEIIAKYKISDEVFFELLARFNSDKPDVVRSGNEELIIYELFTFLKIINRNHY